MRWLSISYNHLGNRNYAIHEPQIGLQGATRTDIREVYEDHDQTIKVSVPESDRNSLIDDTEFDRLQMDRFLNIESRGMFRESRGMLQVLTNDQLIPLPCHVHGFSLRSRKWGRSIVSINEGSAMLNYSYSLIGHRSFAGHQGI